MSRLKEIRNFYGYTQDVVAAHIGITRAAYTNLENGKRQCDAPTLLKLSALYNVTVGCILGVEPIAQQNEKQPPAAGEELDNQLISMLMDLNPQDVQRVQDFVEGLKAARKEQPSQIP